MFQNVCRASVILMLAFLPTVVKAQVSAPNPADVAQVVGLFSEACLNFPGNAYGVRSWAVIRNLPIVPPDQASPFLNGEHGMVFGASNSSGKHVLISMENGGCEVIAMSDDFEAVKRAMVAALIRRGATVSPAYHRVTPDGSDEQQIYRAVTSQNHLLLSVTKQAHLDAPDLAPTIILVLTIDNGKPAADQ